MPDCGSSPHPWGTRSVYAGPQAGHRFIPTPVGNTRWGSGRAQAGPVHPHTRGEHRGAGHVGKPLDGSSPHPWGTPLRGHRRQQPNRFIPTPVGNTGEGIVNSRFMTVHPHTRGEHGKTSPGRVRADGSSPHPWGTRRHNPRGWPCGRFIPTPVGNTTVPAPRVQACAVHPHTRGEHVGSRPTTGRYTGSSPHPWGTHRLGAVDALVQRFIPTPVGNTTCRLQGRASGSVHPHTRGEHYKTGVLKTGLGGSSPHPWGTPVFWVRV